jgi:hypothetical protein
MIEAMVEKSCGAARAKARVRAASIERALCLAGADARLVFPIDPEPFFAAEDTPERVEVVHPVENEEVMAA